MIFVISNEKIAHDLTMVYLSGRYGIEVSGNFSVSSRDGEVSGGGEVSTKYLPDFDEIDYVKLPTGQKYFFNLLNEYEKIENGYKTDMLFSHMIDDYFEIYKRFYDALISRDLK